MSCVPSERTRVYGRGAEEGSLSFEDGLDDLLRGKETSSSRGSEISHLITPVKSDEGKRGSLKRHLRNLDNVRVSANCSDDTTTTTRYTIRARKQQIMLVRKTPYVETVSDTQWKSDLDLFEVDIVLDFQVHQSHQALACKPHSG